MVVAVALTQQQLNTHTRRATQRERESWTFIMCNRKLGDLLSFWQRKKNIRKHRRRRYDSEDDSAKQFRWTKTIFPFDWLREFDGIRWFCASATTRNGIVQFGLLMKFMFISTDVEGLGSNGYWTWCTEISIICWRKREFRGKRDTWKQLRGILASCANLSFALSGICPDTL